MDFAPLLGPAVVAAGVAGVISIVGLIVSNRTARAIHTEKLASDRDLAERKFTFDKDLAERKAAADTALAEKKLAFDRAFAAWKRKTELAEQVLADFYEARDIIAAARSPGGFGDEGGTRHKEEWETADDTRVLNSYYRTAERLHIKSDFFSQLWARRNRFIALFPSEAAKLYDDLFDVRNEIFRAVHMLMGTHRQPERAQEDRKAWETTMGWSPDDPITTRLNEIIEGMDKLCRPVIQAITQ
jgi:hypothetical protein